MKIRFPLWVVHDPTPVSELVDVRWQARDFAHLESVLIGGGDRMAPRAPTLYTDETEATADAQARLAARDAAARAGWVPLHSLPRGTLFETDDGVLGVSLGRDGPRHEVAFLAPTINAGMAVPMDSLALVRPKKVA